MLDIFQEKVSSSYFPVIIFTLALFKDLVLDPIVFASTIILPPFGWLLGIFVSIIVGGVILLWRFIKLDFGFKKMGKFSLGVGAATAVSILPIVRLILPEYTALVLITYFMEKREAKKKQSAIVA